MDIREKFSAFRQSLSFANAWPIIPWLLYKLIEDRLLQKANTLIDQHLETIMPYFQHIKTWLPVVTWLLILVTVVLVWRGAKDRAKAKVIPQLEEGFGQDEDTTPEFFRDRAELDKEYPFEKRINSVSEIYAFYTTGERFFQRRKDYNKLKQLILPNPDANSLEVFEASIPKRKDIISQNRKNTELAFDNDIQVKWYPEFTGFSFWFGDPHSGNGWVHIELVMPCAYPEERPSITIHKSKDEILFNRLWKAYEEMWEKSKLPFSPAEIQVLLCLNEPSDPKESEVTVDNIAVNHTVIGKCPKKKIRFGVERLKRLGLVYYSLDNDTVRLNSEGEKLCYKLDDQGEKYKPPES